MLASVVRCVRVVRMRGPRFGQLVAAAAVSAGAVEPASPAVAERIGQTRTLARRRAWSLMGALSFGFGVWGMHFIAMLAFTSAIEPLRVANQLAGQVLFRWHVYSEDGQPIPCSNGVPVMPEGPLPAMAPASCMYRLI